MNIGMIFFPICILKMSDLAYSKCDSVIMIVQYMESVIVMEVEKKNNKQLVLPGGNSKTRDASGFDIAAREFYDKVCFDLLSREEAYSELEENIIDVHENDKKELIFCIDLTETNTGDLLSEVYECGDNPVSRKMNGEVFRIYLTHKNLLKYTSFTGSSQKAINNWRNTWDS